MHVDPVVEVSGASVRYAGDAALSNVDFRMFPGEVHSLMGENGAGKSTLIRAITGVIPLDSGTMRLDGTVAQLHEPAAGAEGRHPDRLPRGGSAAEPVGRREHHARPRAAPAGRHRLVSDARRARASARRVSGSTSTPPARWAASRSPCSSSWPSPARSPRSSRCWCSTSRRRASIRTRSRSCSGSSVSCGRAGSPSSSSRTSSSRCTRSATG